ncbi:hypothetical protein OAN76_02550 [Candidatus Marinimicrobia bacterium]|nr:hypothetical protein [Candidatus Neomarinimicrobiota bacterium]|tara:strand:- start:5686 stop:6441 length:756 start_codon:yes stop_codon:yes gene_type:complete
MADIMNIGDSNANLTELEMLANERQQDNAQAETQESVKADSPESAEQEKGLPEQDWEKSAKYYQSEKDKMYTENMELKSKLEKLSEAEPVQEEVAIQPPESFDPWEAYNDPNSESYQFRQNMEQINIAKAVSSSQKNLEDKMQVDKKLQEFDNELSQQGLSAEDKNSFYAFANKPLSQLGTDKLVKMWQAADGKVNTLANASGPREFDKVRQNQLEPTPLGVLQGESPPAVDESDETWDRIMSATNRTRIL